MNYYSPLIFASIFLFASCQTENKGTTNAETKEEVRSVITISPVLDSPAYNSAKIGLVAPTENSNVSSGDVSFAYQVDNYELGNQTPDADSKLCANSAEGQHIHNILNNEPYGAYYTDSFDRTLDDGHYVSLSFLSRSYHESIKAKDAYILHQFTVGDAEHVAMDLSGPHMFYSRPKGTYLGKDTEKLLLDFYLVNTEISPTGNKVRATINGEEFMIENWVPYIIDGLPMGDVSIKLELLDASGNLIPGPFNQVKRTVTLAQDEPLE